jgi:hypothetical protein
MHYPECRMKPLYRQHWQAQYHVQRVCPWLRYSPPGLCSEKVKYIQD